MKILIDENMPYAQALFSQIGEVIAKAGRQIEADDLIDIDALMIRSVTRVNESLLEKANRLKFVGSATAGMDHVDQELLASRDIFFTNAPGCNKVGVAEYVMSALMVLSSEIGFDLKDKTLGIIGAGQVGSYLAKVCEAVGMKVLFNDPPKQAQGDKRTFTPIDTLLNESDIITLHTPLTQSGEHATYHLIDDARLVQMRSDQILINAARGPVVDNQALKQRLALDDGFTAILDVFEPEPNVDLELLPLLRFATPHIAGYGLEGKARGTTMIFNSYCEFLGKAERAFPDALLPQAPISQVNLNQAWDQSILQNLIGLIYDVRYDDALFRRHIQIQDPIHQAQAFDGMRKNYWDRREYSAITINYASHVDVNALNQIGFKVLPAQSNK